MRSDLKQLEKRLSDHLAILYGEDIAIALTGRFMDLLSRFREQYPDQSQSLTADRTTERDAILITYSDMVQAPNEVPLKTLSGFLRERLDNLISTLHILPFYPYSSDDGFAVIDYRRVNPDLGTWKDIAKLNSEFRLMFDAVVNHASSQNHAFQGFLKGDPKYQSFFTVIEPGTDLTRVFRPRATPLLTPFETSTGKKLVWTTFGADQVDLNYCNPDVLLEVVDILLLYVSRGAEFIRLDAIAYAWKEIGTTCINLLHTHRIVQIMRCVLDIVAPGVQIITETNVPHEDNIAYFGDGNNEAQLIYNFALPLLTLHAFQKGDVGILSDWAATLDLPSDNVTFFNFLAAHDGIGILPVQDILSHEEINDLAAHTQALGGNVSFKSNEDGTQSPYELNINYLDVLGDPSNPESLETDSEFVAKRFLASQAVMLALRGVPGIYFHSLFGSRNWTEGVGKSQRFRTINRQKMHRGQLEAELDDPNSIRHHVFNGYKKLLAARMSSPAFHPNAKQEILSVSHSVFSLLRVSTDSKTRILCLHNISRKSQEITVNLASLSLHEVSSLTDILNQKEYPVSGNLLALSMRPYEILWLSKDI